MPSAPPPSEEPEAKRHKAGDEGGLQPEADWLEAHPGAATVHVAVPQVEAEPALRGQTLELALPGLGETVAEIKTRLEAALGLAVAKQKLAVVGHGFLKDNLSLAFYNLPLSGAQLKLELKTRGGRK